MRTKLVGLLSLLSCQGIATVCLADNPIAQTMFTADPAPLVHNGVFYMFTGHDEDGAGWFDMREWRLFSTTDMANWTDLGSPMNLKTFSWANVDAWAAQCVFRNGKFYYYVPIRLSGDRFGIGVGVSDKPEGPYSDAIGKPLLEGDSYIDPTVFVDDDGQAYMYWGNGHLWMVKLNADMISTSGAVVDMPRNKETFDNTFGEGPWLDKRDGLYYLLFASLSEPAPGVGPNANMENIRYSTSSSPTGPWKYRGMIMPPEGVSWTNHAGVANYKGNSYFIYHNGMLPGGGNGQRSVCVEQFTYNADGTIPTIKMSKTGPKQIEPLNPFTTVQAETIAYSAGLKTEKCSDTGAGMNVTAINNGDYLKVNGVDFGSGATSLEARVASATSGGTIELYLDSQTGTKIGTCAVQNTGGAQKWATTTCTVAGATGTHDLFFKFTGGSGELFKFNWWKFSGPGAATTADAGVADTAGETRDVASTGGAGGATGTGGRGAGGTTGTGGQSGSGGRSIATGGAAEAGGTAGKASGGASTSWGGSLGIAGQSGEGGQGGADSAASGTGSGGRLEGGGGAPGGSGGSPSGSGGSGGGERSGPGASGCSCRVGSARRDRASALAAAAFLGALLFLGRRAPRHQPECPRSSWSSTTKRLPGPRYKDKRSSRS